MFRLIFNSIKRFYIRNNNVGILLSVMLISCISATFFCIVRLSEEVNELASYNDSYRQFQIDLLESEDFADLEQLIPQIEKMDIQNIELVLDNDIQVSAYIRKSRYTVNWGCYFDDSDTPQIIVTAALDNKLKIGDKINIGDTEYLIIGKRTAFIDHHEVNYSSLTPDTKIKQLKIILTNYPSDSYSETLYNKLSEIFSGIITKPIKRDILSEYTNQANFFIMLLILALAFVNVAAVFDFTLLKRAREFSIYRLCGCSRIKCIFLCFLEILFSFVVHFLLTTVMFKVAVETILIYSGMLRSRTTLSQIMICFLANLIMIITLVIPVLIRNFKKTPNRLYKG